ncbi:MAG: ABC transporter substrate-binding protein [Treponema sp.]|jgi:peptide/nickel transport system substrate-binding protein|nr:ABC transporter substrate-binding protein [Treponema sp.]
MKNFCVRFLLTIAFFTFCSAIVAAGGKKDAATASSGKTLIVGELWEIENVDPVLSGTHVVEKTLIAEPLVEIDNNFNIMPGLAQSWRNIDNLTWEFKLKENVFFHDGTPFDAEAARWSLTRAVNESPSVQSLSKIDRIEVVDPHTIRVITKTTNADLPEVLHYSNTGIIAKSSVDASGKFIKPVGTGPFVFSSFNPGSGNVEVVKNQRYHGKPANLDRVIFRPITDPNTRALAIENGEIDFTIDPPLNEINRMRNLQGITIKPYETPRVYIAQMNMKHSPLNDIKVRQALSHAIDNNAIVDHVLYGIGSPAIGSYSSNIAWVNRSLAPYAYDPALAKRLLAEAGYTDTNGDGILDKAGKPLELRMITYPERPGLPPIAQALQGYFADIGVTLKVDIMTSSATSAALRQPDWDFYLMANATTMIPTPAYHLNSAFSTASNAATGGYSNPEVDKLLEELVGTFDLSKKYEIARQIQQIVHDDAAVIWIAYYGVGIVMKDTVTGFVFNPTAHDYMLNTEMTIR